jgi:hypothetical protein
VVCRAWDQSVPLRDDWFFSPFVDLQLENIRARIVADNIEIKFPAHDLRAIDLGSQNHFVIRIWPSEKVPERIDNATAAAGHNRFRVVALCCAVIGREIAPAIELVAGKHEAAAFDRNVAHGSDPGVTRISRGRTIQLDALRIHCRPHQGQVVLPADDGAHPSQGSFEHRHGGSVTKAPYQPLRSGRHYFAVFAEVGTVFRKGQNCAIECAAIALNYSDHEIDAAALCGLAKRFDRRSRDVYTALPVAPELFPAGVGARTNHRSKIHASGIRGDKRLGKHDKPRPLASSLHGKGLNFFERPLTVKHDRGGLHYSRLESFHGECRLLWFSVCGLHVLKVLRAA